MQTPCNPVRGICYFSNMCYFSSMNTETYSRREREVMDIVYRLERATVADVRAEMADPPSYSAVRALLGTMVDKGHLRQDRAGRAYVYAPAKPVTEARASALRRVLGAFFGGSAAKAAVALVELEPLAADDLAALKQAIERAEAAGR